MIIIAETDWEMVDGFRLPIMYCPSCGTGLLGNSSPHGIKSDGTVYASVICVGCSFHDHVKLNGWPGHEIPHQ